jgi:hypothetical protein
MSIFRQYIKKKLPKIILNPLDFDHENVRSQYPVKRIQALLGSNLMRDNRMQIALNNAAKWGSGLLSRSLHHLSIFQAFLPMP